VRVGIDFGSANAGKSPYFMLYDRLDTWVALTQPTIHEYQNGQYYFDIDWTDTTAIPAGVGSIVFKATITGTGNEQWGVISSGPTSQPAARYVMDFGSTLAGLRPTFDYYSDILTLRNLSQPPIYEGGVGLYYFDATWYLYPDTVSIQFKSVLSGVEVSDVLTVPPPAATVGVGGAATLLSLRNQIRSRSDTENDPHITDAELNGWINASYFEMYGLLVMSYGDDYFTATAQITTDGQTQTYPLPNGTLYNSAPAFFKGQLVELISGPYANPLSPVTLFPFNFREKNRYNMPGAWAAASGPYLFPRYRLVGSGIMFSPLPQTSLIVRLWYAPQLAPLVYDTDVANDLNGWLELVVTDCCIKAKVKQDRDAAEFLVAKAALQKRIEDETKNRNLAEPNSVVETEPVSPFGSTTGPWGGGYW